MKVAHFLPIRTCLWIKTLSTNAVSSLLEHLYSTPRMPSVVNLIPLLQICRSEPYPQCYSIFSGEASGFGEIWEWGPHEEVNVHRKEEGTDFVPPPIIWRYNICPSINQKMEFGQEPSCLVLWSRPSLSQEPWQTCCYCLRYKFCDTVVIEARADRYRLSECLPWVSAVLSFPCTYLFSLSLVSL